MSLQIWIAQWNCDHWKSTLILKSPLKDSDTHTQKSSSQQAVEGFQSIIAYNECIIGKNVVL